MTTVRSVPTLDLTHYQETETRPVFIDDLFASLSDFGFVVIKEHGITDGLLQKAYAMNQELFALTEPTKNMYQVGSGGERGYTAFGQEKAKDNPFSDLKEFWHIGAELNEASRYFSRYPKNVWPQELPEFKACFLELYHQLHGVAAQLLEAIGAALKLDGDYFPTLVNDGNSVLRLIHYPPVKGMNTQDQMRAAPHADINLMTLLVGATDAGLQLLDRDGSWIDVDAKPGEIIVDTGDMMALITNNVLPATVHRVINPDVGNTARYSMPFFLHPHDDALLSCLPQCVGDNPSQFEDITAGDFLQKRLRENNLKT